MCGRFNLRNPADIQQRFGFVDWHERRIEPHFNIAPSQEILTFVSAVDGRVIVQPAKWGLEPFWLAGTGRKPPINARAESLASSRMFREALRCLIPASGFYEWQVGTRTPMHIQLESGEPFAFAGLWLPPGRDGGLPSACIVTTPANALMREIHDRMPAILLAEAERAWLDPGRLDIASLLQPYPAERMQAYAVSPLVNSWENEGAALIAPAAPLQPSLW